MNLVAFGLGLYAYLILSNLLFLLIYSKKRSLGTVSYKSDEWPIISVFVAAKDEEKNINNCLNSLQSLDYPSDKIEILVGNDQSVDDTEILIQKWANKFDNIKLHNIHHKIGKADAKANVLAQLALVAKGEIYAIVDADIVLNPNWLKSMLTYLKPNVGIVSGCTIVKGHNILSKMQEIEWLHAFGLIEIAKFLNIPVTAVGNNMIISRKAYESTGGYENIKFSITEDYQLFKETLKKKWKYDNVVTHSTLAHSSEAESLTKLLNQRRRWMQGAIQLPIFMVVFLSLQSLFFPIFLVGLYYFPFQSLIVWICKIFIQNNLIKNLYNKIGESTPTWRNLFLYDVYSQIISFIVILYFIIPTKIVWKGRKF